jgi:predicted metalloendopeptidase
MAGSKFWRRCAVLVSVAAVVLSAGCASTVPGASPAPASGLELAGYDRATRPADDLYRFANGNWLAKTQIPPDLPEVGAFTMLQLQTQADQRSLIEAAARNSANPHHDSYHDPTVEANARKIGDLYASYMDTARLDHLGAARPESERTKLLTDPHSPGQFRCNGVVPNVDAFYQAFTVKPGDRLYKTPADRIHIW